MKDLPFNQNLISAKQQLERDFSKFIKEKYSKGPNKIVVNLYDECIVCNFSGYLNKAEEFLVQSSRKSDIYINRSYFIHQCAGELETICLKVLNKKIQRFFPSYILEKNEGCWVIFFDNEL